MNCSNFIFDGESLSDYGMIVCDWNTGAGTPWSGGDVTFTTGKTPDSDRQTFYTASYENLLSCTLSICKNPGGYTDRKEAVITREEYSALSRWLKRSDGYHLLQFDQDGYGDIYFHAKIDMQPYMVCGSIVGFDLAVTTDSPYGYSRLYKNTFELAAGESFSFENYSDKPGIIYPKVIIIPKADGTLKLNSGINTDIHTTEIKNCKANHKIVLDNDNDYFEGITDPNGFNFEFPVIANSYTGGNNGCTNIFSLSQGSISCTVTTEYRLVRMVTI